MSRSVPVSRRPARANRCGSSRIACEEPCPTTCPTGPTGPRGPQGQQGSAGSQGTPGPTGPTGASSQTTLPDPNGGLLFNNEGAAGTSLWIYDVATQTVTTPSSGSQLVGGIAGGPFTVWARGGTGGFQDPEFLVFNGDALGTPASATPEGFFQARDAAMLTLDDGAAFIEAVRGGAFPDFPNQFLETGEVCFPNFAIGGAQLSPRPWAGGTGVFALQRVVAEPDPNSPAASESQFWITASDKLMEQTPTGDQRLLGDAFQTLAFAADADQALTLEQSRANLYVIANGTITVPRRMTSLLEPTTARFVVVRNDNDQAVDWAWATGLPATVPAHSARIITGDNTDAVAIALT